MGMFNEVYSRCPKCNDPVYEQISQVVLGFGGFVLENPESMQDLTDEELLELKDKVSRCTFHCEGCGHSFNHFTKFRDNTGKLKMIEEMFKPEE